MTIEKQLQTISYTEQDGIAYITLLSPRSNMRMLQELTEICDHIEDHSACTVVVIQGSDNRFNLGLDFADFQPDKPMDIHGFHKWEKLCTRIERMKKVTIAVLDGAVVGGGLQLALCTDHRIATPRAFFSLPEVKLGFLPGMSVFRLAKYIGLGRAKQMVLQGREISAPIALDWGIIDSVTDDVQATLSLALSQFQPMHPITIQLARRLLNESFHDSFEDAVGHFLAAQQRAISQDQFLHTIHVEANKQQ